MYLLYQAYEMTCHKLQYHHTLAWGISYSKRVCARHMARSN